MVVRSGSSDTPDEEKLSKEEQAAASERAPVYKPVFRPTIKENNLIFNSKAPGEVQTGAHREPGGWMHAPANFGINVLGYGRLLETTTMMGAPATEVKYIRAAIKPGTKFLYIWPTDGDDPDKIELTEHGGLVYMNLLDILVKGNLRVPTGVKRFFAVGFAGAEDPVEPALKVDLGRIIQEVPDNKNRKKSSDPKPEMTGEGI